MTVRNVTRKSADPRRASQRGVVLVLVGFFLMLFMGIAALSTDMSYLYIVKNELQAASDSAARAAAAALRDGGTRAEAIEAAKAIALANEAGGKPVELDPARDVVFGDYDHGIFQEEGFANAAAVKVVARRTEDSFNGPVDLNFARIWYDHVDVTAEAVASLKKRDIVLVQDITWSFKEEIEDAKFADATLVRAMADQSLPGDRVGVVTFNEAATRNLGLRALRTDETQILQAIGGIRACVNPSPYPCAGTHIAAGFNAAGDVFRGQPDDRAEKVLVLVSDGMPYPASRRQPAIDAANAAGDEGINIFTVTLTQELGGGGQYGGSGADAAFNAGLVRGFGKAYQTPDSKQLDDILLSILKEMPVRLVQ